MWPSPHWRRWLGVESRCVVPFTSFSENEVLPNGSWPPIWFALSEVDNTGMKVSENGAFVAGRISMASDYDHQHQLTLWQEKVRLDEGFLKSLREHPVPVREEAISAIGTRSPAPGYSGSTGCRRYRATYRRQESTCASAITGWAIVG
jgi:hypothetical protein